MSRALLPAALLLAAGLLVGTADAPPAAAQNKKGAPPKGAPKPVAKKAAATPEELYVAPGFKVELLHTADPATEGSWINMAREKPGYLVVTGQQGQPVLRYSMKEGTFAPLKVPFSQAMGLLALGDSLYVNANGPDGFGLYRCRENKATGQYDDVKFLKRFEGSGEHGPHGLAAGPDGKIYVMNGNHTKLPEGITSATFGNYREDHLLPRQWDGNGHAAGILAPGGYVVRTDPDGKAWELVLGGFRNAYDHAFNADGEHFTFDSDMEWDWGMPLYRPTRVNHCVTGSDHGWRSGTGVWPEYYPDNLPPTANVGVGSPTGVTNGIGAKFPAKYQKAIYICDWTYGRLFAVHLTPDGASYKGAVEPFVCPLGLMKEGAAKKPLNLTDAVVGDDGAMYFTTGGRNTQGALYRVTYTGTEPTAPADLHDAAGADARKLRHELEAFHGKADPKAVAFAWPHLSSDDRFIRFAARVAVESQPVAGWLDKAFAETNPNGALTALLAVARCGDAKTQPALLAALDKLPLDTLSPSQKFDKLRVLGVSFSRQGRPGLDATKRVLAELDPKFPGPDATLNRELAQVLIFLNAPKIAERCLKRMAQAKTQEDTIHYLFHLRTLPIGQWTTDQRKEYLGYWTKDRSKYGHPAELEAWFKAAGRPYADGNSYANFMKNFLREAVINMSDAERKELGPTLVAIDKQAVVSYDVKPRKLVKEWKTDELAGSLAKADKGRNYDRGREMFIAGQCVKCHRFGQEGGAVGPELTAISSRFSRRDLLESMTEPSKVLSDQYQNEKFTTTTGKSVVGRIVDETKDDLVVQPDPLAPERVTIKKADLESRTVSKVSPMPANLLDTLTEDEVLDLLAFLESSGNKKGKAFGK